MKIKSFLSAAALAVSALCASAPASAAIVFSFSPSSSHINVGESVVVDVSISGLGDEILSSLDINFFYTGGAASNTGGSYNNSILGAGAQGGFDVILPTQVGIFAWSNLLDDALAGVQLNDLLIGTLTFAGVSDGVTTIALGSDPDFERNFVGRDALSLAVNVGSACIAVGTGSCAVPEPASLALLGIGLAGLGYSRRRKV